MRADYVGGVAMHDIQTAMNNKVHRRDSLLSATPSRADTLGSLARVGRGEIRAESRTSPPRRVTVSRSRDSSLVRDNRNDRSPGRPSVTVKVFTSANREREREKIKNVKFEEKYQFDFKVNYI